MVVFFAVLLNIPCTTVQEKPFIVIITLDFIYSISFKEPRNSLVFLVQRAHFLLSGVVEDCMFYSH